MRQWRNFWLGLSMLGQYNPPQLVETLMLALSMVLFIVWLIVPASPYLLLGLVFTVGACASILVRESRISEPRPRPTQVAATVLLLISLYGVADLIRNS
ncbi:DUF4175 domain-containing protein [Myxacorys almedinensis]|uniref:Uncharacterized protein n=1 Tax=Myxacorys almedinensis A TaxID=2690445 RepID=A0A8J7Z164_9CYAN|nr:DUF4175 domain-containing protein [Myxacorys almedinensis]NDJ15866.1 hypothetical protein [Myxacorys almedinensis A]